MISHLTKYVKEVAETKEYFEWNSFLNSRIEKLEKELDKEEITIDDAMEALKKEKEIRIHFTREDFENLERKIKFH